MEGGIPNFHAPINGGDRADGPPGGPVAWDGVGSGPKRRDGEAPSNEGEGVGGRALSQCKEPAVAWSSEHRVS